MSGKCSYGHVFSLYALSKRNLATTLGYKDLHMTGKRAIKHPIIYWYHGMAIPALCCL